MSEKKVFEKVPSQKTAGRTPSPSCVPASGGGVSYLDTNTINNGEQGIILLTLNEKKIPVHLLFQKWVHKQKNTWSSILKIFFRNGQAKHFISSSQ